MAELHVAIRTVGATINDAIPHLVECVGGLGSPAIPCPWDDISASAAPIIISESPTHVVIAAEISKAMLVGYRRLFEQLIAADEQRESPR